MRAVVFRKYGAPTEVMELVNDRETPAPRANEVLVKVERSSVNAADRHMVRANYLIIRLMLGLFRPAQKKQVLGMDISGTIHAVGEGVDGFHVGDAVAADIRSTYGGGFAEYTVVGTEHLVRKPAEVSFEQAATVPISGQAAMMGLTLCAIEPGDNVLINGASGGVGSFAVQIAKAQGARVTAICSAEKANVVKSWGADEVVDYTSTSVGDLRKGAFDAVFDAACFGSPRVLAGTLKDNGRYVLVGGTFYNMLRVKLFGRWYATGTQQFRSLTQDVEVTTNIELLLGMIARGEVRPHVQETISLSEVPDAIHRLEQRAVVGKIVVNNQRAEPLPVASTTG